MMERKVGGEPGFGLLRANSSLVGPTRHQALAVVLLWQHTKSTAAARGMAELFWLGKALEVVKANH